MKEYHHLGTKQLTGWRKRFDFVCDRRMFAHIAAMSTTLRTAHHLFYPDNFIASACTADFIAYYRMQTITILITPLTACLLHHPGESLSEQLTADVIALLQHIDRDHVIHPHNSINK